MWTPDVYQVVPSQAGLVRDSDEKKDLIKCDDKKAAYFTCIHQDDMKSLIDFCLEQKK